MVEIEVRKSVPTTQTTETTTIDVNEIIGKVRSFVDSVRSMQGTGEQMAVNVERFNFTVSKENGEYDLTLKLNLSVKPKQAA